MSGVILEELKIFAANLALLEPVDSTGQEEAHLARFINAAIRKNSHTEIAPDKRHITLDILSRLGSYLMKRPDPRNARLIAIILKFAGQMDLPDSEQNPLINSLVFELTTPSTRYTIPEYCRRLTMLLPIISVHWENFYFPILEYASASQALIKHGHSEDPSQISRHSDFSSHLATQIQKMHTTPKEQVQLNLISILHVHGVSDFPTDPAVSDFFEALRRFNTSMDTLSSSFYTVLLEATSTIGYGRGFDSFLREFPDFERTAMEFIDSCIKSEKWPSLIYIALNTQNPILTRHIAASLKNTAVSERYLYEYFTLIAVLKMKINHGLYEQIGMPGEKEAQVEAFLLIKANLPVFITQLSAAMCTHQSTLGLGSHQDYVTLSETLQDASISQELKLQEMYENHESMQTDGKRYKVIFNFLTTYLTNPETGNPSFNLTILNLQNIKNIFKALYYSNSFDNYLLGKASFEISPWRVFDDQKNIWISSHEETLVIPLFEGSEESLIRGLSILYNSLNVEVNIRNPNAKSPISVMGIHGIKPKKEAFFSALILGIALRRQDDLGRAAITWLSDPKRLPDLQISAIDIILNNESFPIANPLWLLQTLEAIWKSKLFEVRKHVNILLSSLPVDAHLSDKDYLFLKERTSELQLNFYAAMLPCAVFERWRKFADPSTLEGQEIIKLLKQMTQDSLISIHAYREETAASSEDFREIAYQKIEFSLQMVKAPSDRLIREYIKNKKFAVLGLIFTLRPELWNPSFIEEILENMYEPRGKENARAEGIALLAARERAGFSNTIDSLIDLSEKVPADFHDSIKLNIKTVRKIATSLSNSDGFLRLKTDLCTQGKTLLPHEDYFVFKQNIEDSEDPAQALNYIIEALRYCPSFSLRHDSIHTYVRKFVASESYYYLGDDGSPSRLLRIFKAVKSHCEHIRTALPVRALSDFMSEASAAVSPRTALLTRKDTRSSNNEKSPLDRIVDKSELLNTSRAHIGSLSSVRLPRLSEEENKMVQKSIKMLIDFHANWRLKSEDVRKFLLIPTILAASRNETTIPKILRVINLLSSDTPSTLALKNHLYQADESITLNPKDRKDVDVLNHLLIYLTKGVNLSNTLLAYPSEAAESFDLTHPGIPNNMQKSAVTSSGETTSDLAVLITRLLPEQGTAAHGDSKTLCEELRDIPPDHTPEEKRLAQIEILTQEADKITSPGQRYRMFCTLFGLASPSTFYLDSSGNFMKEFQENMDKINFMMAALSLRLCFDTLHLTCEMEDEIYVRLPAEQKRREAEAAAALARARSATPFQANYAHGGWGYGFVPGMMGRDVWI